MQAHSHHRQDSHHTWQDQFVAWLPTIQKQLRFAFRRHTPEAQDEAVQEALANCCIRYHQLHQQKRAEAASPTSLAQFAIRQVRCGRTIATRLNCRDPLSPYAQCRKAIKVEPLECFCPGSGEWLPVFVADLRASVAEQAALRIDTREWLDTLTHRLRRIACDLAMGFSTSEVAVRYGLSPSRISQLRTEFYESWLSFQGLLPAAAAA